MVGEIQLKNELISRLFFLWPRGLAEGRDQACVCWSVFRREKVEGTWLVVKLRKCLNMYALFYFFQINVIKVKSFYLLFGFTLCRILYKKQQQAKQCIDSKNHHLWPTSSVWRWLYLKRPCQLPAFFHMLLCSGCFWASAFGRWVCRPLPSNKDGVLFSCVLLNDIPFHRFFWLSCMTYTLLMIRSSMHCIWI